MLISTTDNTSNTLTHKYQLIDLHSGFRTRRWKRPDCPAEQRRNPAAIWCRRREEPQHDSAPTRDECCFHCPYHSRVPSTSQKSFRKKRRTRILDQPCRHPQYLFDCCFGREDRRNFQWTTGNNLVNSISNHSLSSRSPIAWASLPWTLSPSRAPLTLPSTTYSSLPSVLDGSKQTWEEPMLNLRLKICSEYSNSRMLSDWWCHQSPSRKHPDSGRCSPRRILQQRPYCHSELTCTPHHFYYCVINGRWTKWHFNWTIELLVLKLSTKHLKTFSVLNCFLPTDNLEQ